MRITFSQILILLLMTVLSYAEPTSAQEVLNKKISLSVEHKSLNEILKALAKTNQVQFIYNKEIIQSAEKISVNVTNETLKQVLDKLLKKFSIGYQVFKEKVILVNTKTPEGNIGSTVDISAVQVITVTGKVTDDSNQPLPGVSVKLKGTTTGTQTDLNGNYSLTIADNNATLVFSYIGFDSQEVLTDGRVKINIQLKATKNSLNEVVVVGYGRQKKTNVTGSIASANLDAFRDAPNTNIAQSLQGAVPGLNVGPVTIAGSTPSISVRGRNSINGNQNALIILDGIQYNNSLNSINPDDIASIDVLKDASSTAVYGAQAANGVILVTSRKGLNNSKPRINFSSSYSTQSQSGNLRPMNREEYLDHVRTLYYTQAYLAPAYTQPNPAFNLANRVDVSQRDAAGNIVATDFDWNKQGTKTGFINDNQLSISGGGDKVNYLISGAYTNQAGYVINDLFKRKSLRTNIETQPASWLKVGLQAFGSFVNQDGAEPSLNELRQLAPLNSPYNADGSLNPYPYNTVTTNPFLTYDVNDYERHNYYFANIYTEVNFPFLKGLTYRINFGNNARTDEHYFASKYGAGLTGSAYKNNEQYYDYTLDNIVTYNNTFKKHNITATLLYGSVQRKDDYTQASANGFTRLTLGYNNLQQGTNQFATSQAWTEALNYQMGRINYAYDNKYLLTATVRRDGFSGFSENNKFGIFPSGSVGWVFSEEPFLENTWLNFGKLRIGYGISGNQTNRYSSLNQVTTQTAYVFGDGGTTQYGQFIGTLANPDLKWERTYELNVGVDFTLLKSRLTGSIDYYDRHTKDLLFNVQIPNVTGYSGISTNIGEVGNKGAELTLTSKNIVYKNFKWSTTLNFSRNVNKVIKLLGTGDLIASNLFIGQPINAVYGYTTNGIYQVGEKTPAGYYTGNYRVVDINGDGVVNTADRKILGSGDPAYRFSVLNNFQYKNFNLSVFFNSIQGGKNGYLGNNSQSIILNDNNVRWNYLSAVDFWSPSNPNGEYPLFTTSPTVNPSVYRDRSFIRLQDITLSYQINNGFTKRLSVQNFRVFASGKNLITWTKWKGWDPEIASGGLNLDGRPLLVGYSLGLSLTF